MIQNGFDVQEIDSHFDPFVDLLQAREARPAFLQQVNLRTLTPFQRALLVIDGTVTKFIEAYVLEPIEVIKLRQRSQRLEADHTWLEASKDTEVIAREVMLRGDYSGTIYTYAVSLLVPNRLPADMLQGLKVDPGGIGRVLLNSQIENRREILWYGYETLCELPEEINQLTGSQFLSRTYRIIAGNKPMMLINEKFPITFGDDRQ